MTEPDLLTICAAAFLAVLSLLTLLAGMIRLLVMLFPEKEDGPDAALLAAITSAATAAYPGTRVTKIEELR
jgi:hypothetical protein